MSFLKSKFSGWLADGTRTPYMGGGGGSPGPSTTYSQTSNIPDYAKPYVNTMLGATQQQLFDVQDGEVTGFQEYKPYSSNMNDYIAGFSPLQQQAQQSAYNLQVPGQYGEASQMTGLAGAGSLGLANQMAGAGQQYAMGATDPRTTQAYMSPYMQNVVDYQKSQALRDFQMGQPLMAKQAVGQGAFGGNRLALQQSEAQRGLMSQLQGIEATGAQSAFQNAQQAQQYGANLGLQGQQAALQGVGQFGQMAGQLGQIGTAQLGAQQGIIGTQAAQGLTQQQQEQSKINQAIQDYATQQQYPLMQLGFMSNMLRGLPMQAQSTQMYQAQPSTLQQGIGLLGAGASLYGAGKAGGGRIKEMAEGGIAGYKYGGAIPEAKLAGMADNLSIQQLQQRLADKELDSGERQIFADALQDKARTRARSEGIAAAGGGLFDTMGYAGGGILAFDDGGEVEHFEEGGTASERRKAAIAAVEAALPDASIVPKDYAGSLTQYLNEPAIKKQMQERQVALDAVERNNPIYAQNVITQPTPLGSVFPVVSKKPVDEPVASKGEPVATEQKDTKAKPGPSAPAAPSKASNGQEPKEERKSNLEATLEDVRKLGPQGEFGADYLDRLKALEASADQRMSRADKIAMAKGFLKFGSTAAPGGIGQAAVAGLGEYTDQYGKAIESDEKFKMENAKLQQDILALRRAEERGDVKLASEIQDKIADRANRLQQAQISASASGSTARQEQASLERVMKENPGMTYLDALQAVKGAGKVESNAITAAKNGLAVINGELTFMKKDDPRRAQYIADRDRLMQVITNAAVNKSNAPAANGNMPGDIQELVNKYKYKG